MKMPSNIFKEVPTQHNKLLFFVCIIYLIIYQARDLSLDQRMNFGDDITSQLRLAKKHHFVKQEEKRISQEIELQVMCVLIFETFRC